MGLWIIPKQLHTLACALDTEALSLDSNEQSQVCAQSLFVRSKPSQSRIWSLKWKRDSWTRHLSGRILRPSLGNRFATEWTSSLGATHASPSVQQASDLEVKTLGISGRISQEAFQFFNQESASLKTSRATLPVGCITFCATWEDWVTEQRGAYSQRLNAERHTRGSECSSWPSPMASEVRQGFQDRSRGMKGSQESLTTVVIKGWPTPNAADSLQGGTTQGNRKDPNLSIAVHGPAVPASSSTDGSRPGWLTPQVQDSKHSGTNQTENGDRDLLVNQVNWPTPMQQDARIGSNNVGGNAHRVERGSVALADIVLFPPKQDQQVKNWATPRVHEHMEPPHQWQVRNIKKKAENPKLGTLDKPLGTMVMEQQKNSGKLNPRWVETLMGLPVGWTMPSCASPVTIERMS